MYSCQQNATPDQDLLFQGWLWLWSQYTCCWWCHVHICTCVVNLSLTSRNFDMDNCKATDVKWLCMLNFPLRHTMLPSLVERKQKGTNPPRVDLFKCSSDTLKWFIAGVKIVFWSVSTYSTVNSYPGFTYLNKNDQSPISVWLQASYRALVSSISMHNCDDQYCMKSDQILSRSGQSSINIATTTVSVHACSLQDGQLNAKPSRVTAWTGIRSLIRTFNSYRTMPILRICATHVNQHTCLN